MPIEAGTYDGLVRSVSTEGLDPLLAPPPRLDESVGDLVMGVNMREVFGMGVEHKDGRSSPHTSGIASHVGWRSPYNAVPFLSRDVLDFSEHAFWRVNFLNSDNFSLGAGYHIDVVLQ